MNIMEAKKMTINEEQRVKILSKYLPKRYLDIYLYLIYKDSVYLPNDLKRESKTRKIKNVELNKEIASLSILLGRSLLENEVIE